MRTTRFRVFISSVQREFEPIRRGLKAFLLGDAMLRRFVSDVFVFEDLPATDRRADEVYLREVERCEVYIGLFGYEYGSEDSEGISPTEREYDHATKRKKTRLVYVWGSDEKQRLPKMRELIRKASGDVVRRRVEDEAGLKAEVYSSLVQFLEDSGALRVLPFDATPSDKANLKDISDDRVRWFIQVARRERNFPLKPNTTKEALLTHLRLSEGSKPLNAAVLLFGSEPQRFHTTALTKCVYIHGTVFRRPFSSMQVFDGDVFAQADAARDFVLSKLDRSVGTRAGGNQAPVAYELPPDAVAEAIVNALAHRDYDSNASVEVRLFSDRLEVWNPGGLPGTLTLEGLRSDHSSIPNNPLLAEALYLTHYIERIGSGTQAMIELCRDAGLPEPDFEVRDGFFVTRIWRDWLTTETLARFELNERQTRAIAFLKGKGRMSNSEYQDLTGAIKRTASRDLDALQRLGLIDKRGDRGPGVHYVLSRKRGQRGDIGDMNPGGLKGDKKGTKGT